MLLSILTMLVAFKSRLTFGISEPSTFGAGPTGGVSSIDALIVRGRPLGRLTASVETKGGLGKLGLTRADAGRSEASGDGPCEAILAANASSTSFASSADKRFL